MTVGSGSTFSVGGGTNYTQAAGTTTVNGTLVGSLVNLSGGVLSGTGTVNADLSNAAVAAPGQPDRLVSSPDELHPSPEGYRLMARALEAAVDELITKMGRLG